MRQPFHHWYRGFIQGKTRITLAWIFAILVGFAATQYPTWPGIALCFAGATLRYWASGYLRKDQYPAVGGPYSFVRNPLYLGTYLMTLGTVLAIENWALLLAGSIIFGAIYHFIILDEETKLRRIFKEPYTTYCRNVPRFFPRIWPPLTPANSKTLLKINPDPKAQAFSLSLANKNKAYEAYASFLGLIAYVALAAFLRNQFFS